MSILLKSSQYKSGSVEFKVDKPYARADVEQLVLVCTDESGDNPRQYTFSKSQTAALHAFLSMEGLL